MDVDRPWLSGLTETQAQAVTHAKGPLLVLAGPGSGKTRVITRRIAHRISEGVPAWQMLALTFTNKAAKEMRSRVEAMLPHDLPGRRGLVVSTFHSFCAGILRKHGADSKAAGIGDAALMPDFTIFDSDDSHALLKDAIEEVGLVKAQWPVGPMAALISEAKNKLLSSSDFAAMSTDFQGRSVAKVYARYERALLKQNALDFDDLLMRTARMLRDDEAMRASFQQRFTEVLIDEYQDTNHAQFTVAHAIACEHRQICVVGDPDQSIYAWRGADISNILEFEEHYPGATVIPLGENFRSTGHIVALADGLIRSNSQRRHKDLYTSLDEGVPPRYARLSEEMDEAQHVVAALEEARERGILWKEMAILYRMNALSRNVEDALRRRGIPYLIVRGTAFFQRREVKDTLGYLRVLVNSRDDSALARIVNVPSRGIGATTMGKLAAISAARHCSLAEAMVGARSAGIAERTAKSIDGLLAIIARYRSELEVKAASNLGPFVARLITEGGLERAAMAEAADEQDAEDRRANVVEVANAAAQFVLPERPPGSPDPTLGDALRGFLESVALVADSDAVDPERGAVTLMSLHASKGLEFDVVAVVGLEDGLLPHARALGSPEQLEEERRLFFVGITRCRKHLHLTSAASRSMRGMRMTTIESGFLRELPGANFVRLDGRSWRGADSDEGDDDDGDGDGTCRRAESRAPGRGGRYPVGATVRSPVFGLGRVEGTTPTGGITIRFRGMGVKTLHAEYAKLELIVPP